MSLTAEFRLRSPHLPLVDVAGANPSLTFRLDSATQPTTGSAVFFVKVEGSSFDGVETALTNAPVVSEYFLISEIESIRMYQIILAGPRPSFYDERMFQKAFLERVTIEPDGWRITRQFIDRDEFERSQELWRSKGISVHLDRLYDSNTTDTELIGLTEKQREALLTAFEMGYFAVPQETTLADIAARLDISRPALGERLTRAQSHLVEHFYHVDH